MNKPEQLQKNSPPQQLLLHPDSDGVVSSSSAALGAQLQLWLQLQLIRPLDFALVQMLQQKAGKTLPDDLWCWLALGSAQLAQGRIPMAAEVEALLKD